MLISVHVTCESFEEARAIAKKLLKERLISCANAVPIESFYVWKGEEKNEKEILLMCKTKKSNFKKIERSVKDIHSYETPCILAFECSDSNEEYLNWVDSTC